MLKNLLLIHLRTLRRNPLLSFTNILGLAIGISACLACYLHIRHELSYDQHHSNISNIYRVVTGDVSNGEGWVKVSAPIPPILRDRIPEVSEFARVARATYDPKIAIRSGFDLYNEQHVYMVDPAFFKVFDYEFIRGEKRPELEKHQILLSSTSAMKLYGENDPMGMRLKLGGENDFVVAGVFNDPSNSHIKLDFVISFENLEQMLPNTSLTSNWGQFNYFAYLLLAEGTTETTVEEKINSIVVEMDGDNTMQLDELNLQPLADIHFTANRGNARPAYDAKYLVIYAAVAFSVALISLINFVNLSMASSTRRIREVGVRKVVGARRWELVVQHVGESFLTTVIAVAIGFLLLYYVLVPGLNTTLQTHISIESFGIELVLLMLLLALLVGASAGAYIAVFVSGFTPSRALRGTLKLGSAKSSFKYLLLGAQFIISVVLILSSLLIYQQLHYLKNKDLGLNPNQVINVSLSSASARDKARLVADEFRRLPWVESVSTTRFVAGEANWHQTAWWEGQEEDESMSVILGDEKFLETLDLQLVEGDPELIRSPLEEGEIRYILNEAAREHIGWEAGLGKGFHIFGPHTEAPVAGVVRNFNYKSLHQQVDPVVIAMHTWLKPGQVFIKSRTDDYTTALGELQNIFAELVPDAAFEYQFLDEQFQQLYHAEQRTSRIVGVLTFLAIFLALLGMYGLITFTVIEKTREISVRKVLGINVKSILLLLSSDYLKLLLVTNLISIPVVYMLMNPWLNNFSYRIELSALQMVAGSALVWIFVLVTVFINVMRANAIDPVQGLRHE